MPIDDDNPEGGPFDEPDDSGLFYRAPDGEMYPVETSDPGAPASTEPVKKARSPMPPWVKGVLIPVVTAAVTAFIAGGGGIYIGTEQATKGTTEHVHLTQDDLDKINQSVADLTGEVAALKAELKSHRDLPAHPKADDKIGALELNFVKVSTLLTHHLTREHQ
jgi:hypothetical protein